LWEASGRRQETICWPRNAPVVASGNKGVPESAPDRRLAAMLYADVANFELLDEQQIPIFLHHVLKRLAAAVESGPVSPFSVKSRGQGLLIAFDTVDAAANCAVALQQAFAGLDLAGLGLPASLALKICGHYGLVHTAFDPFAGQQGLFGSSATLAARMEPVTAPGAVYVSEDFVSALFARGRFAHRAEYVGDHLPLRSSEEYRLFALKAG
jgi:class 3 adenylate cyclase